MVSIKKRHSGIFAISEPLFGGPAQLLQWRQKGMGAFPPDRSPFSDDMRNFSNGVKKRLDAFSSYRSLLLGALRNISKRVERGIAAFSRTEASL